MATIRKRGDSYQIRVSVGYDTKGNHKEQAMTWKPEPGMTQRQSAPWRTAPRWCCASTRPKPTAARRTQPVTLPRGELPERSFYTVSPE